MNQDLFNIVVGVLLTALLGFGAWLVLSQFALIVRVTRIETLFEILGEKFAKVLHSPHTPELDSYLEKYVDKGYELSFNEWRELMERCEAIENDLANPKDQRLLAAFVSALCHHKLALDRTPLKPTLNNLPPKE